MVRITGEGFTTFHDYSHISKTYIKSVLNLGDLKLKSFFGGFKNSFNLDEFNPNGSQFSNLSSVKDFTRMMDFFRNDSMDIDFSDANMSSGLVFDNMFNSLNVNTLNLEGVKIYNSYSFSKAFENLNIADEKKRLVSARMHFSKSY